MKKILVFGTGGAAEKLMENGADIYDIIGFADNNPKKQGTLFHDRRVYAPSEIRGLPFEQIIVASMWFNDIREQLIEQYGIPAEVIRSIPKVFSSAGKRYRPFEDDETRAYAARVLRHVCTFLEERDIPCYVDHGTLLGLVRDNGLMPWDDDLDLSVANIDRPRLYACAGELVATLPDADRMRWKTELIRNSIDEVIALFLTVEDPQDQINAFNAGISFFTLENGLAVEAINWAPQSHYAGGVWIETSLGRYRAPNRFEDYLALHYGNWKTPVKDMAFSQIDNFKRREAPAHWVAWNPAESPSPEPQLALQNQERIHGSRLFVLASAATPKPHQPRIPANQTELEASLHTLAKILHVDVAVVCGADPKLIGHLGEIMALIHRSGLADKIHVEMGLDAEPCAAVLAAMEAVGAQRSFHKKSFKKREDPPVFATAACTDEMRGAIKQFRCRYKKRWMLWNQTLAHCPQALTALQAGNGDKVNPDQIVITPANPDLKAQLLTLFRNRPCAAHAECEADDRVWEPYAIYPFTRSTLSTPPAGDRDD